MSAFRCVNGRPLRSSRSSVDRVLIPAIARVAGTAGVATKQMRAADPDRAPFHAEIYLVDPNRYLLPDHGLSCLPRDVFPVREPTAEGADQEKKRSRSRRKKTKVVGR